MDPLADRHFYSSFQAYFALKYISVQHKTQVGPFGIPFISIHPFLSPKNAILIFLLENLGFGLRVGLISFGPKFRRTIVILGQG